MAAAEEHEHGIALVAANRAALVGGDELEELIGRLQRQLEDIKEGNLARLDGVRARSRIASIAFEILMVIRNQPPRGLVVLLRDLLELTGPPLKGAKRPDERRAAAMAFGEAAANETPRGVRELAHEIGVRPSTVSRWSRNPEFQEEVEYWRQAFLSGRF